MNAWLWRDLLFDTYKGLLTDRQRLAFELHHHDDLSYGEMAMELGCSRPAALDLLQRAQTALEFYESKLSVVARSVQQSEEHRQLLEFVRQGRLAEVEDWLQQHVGLTDGAKEELFDV